MAANRTIITIARQEDSGGREIAQCLAKSLKFSYDEKLDTVQVYSRSIL